MTLAPLLSLLACPVCFGDPSSPQSHGLRLAIGFLLAVTVALLTGIALVARSWALRAQVLERQGGSSGSPGPTTS